MIRYSAALLALSSGCSDQVVGYFDDTISLGESSSDSGPGSTSIGAVTVTGLDSSSDGADGSADSDETSTTGPGDALGPCTPIITDNFDGPGLDESLWFNWAELDSSWWVENGFMYFRAPTSRHPDDIPADTGLVATPDHQLPDDNFAIRMEVVAPPLQDQPIVLFFMLLDSEDDASVSMRVRPFVQVDGKDPAGIGDYNVDIDGATAPRWIGIAVLGDEAHFQISDDGIDWTTVYVGPMFPAFAPRRTLIMVQTVGDVPDPPDIKLDNYSVCEL